MKRIVALTIVMIYSVLVYSTPSWMWISRYNQLSSNTNCGAGIWNAIDNDDAFWNGAMFNHPNGGPIPYEPLGEHVLGWDVKWSILTQRFPTSWSDFIFFQGHGQAHAIHGLSDDTSGCYPWSCATWKLGQNEYGTRWAYFMSCDVLKITNDFYDWWSGAFDGIQCIIGFGNSFYGENYAMTATIQNFWERWTGYNGSVPQRTLADAHYKSCFENMYKGGYSTIPVTASSNRAGSQLHIYADDTYDNATSEKGLSQCFWYYRDNLTIY
jgi:hypothetical protein